VSETGLVISLVATAVTIIGSLGTLMKWLIDARSDELSAKIGAVDSKVESLDRRVGNVETLVLQHLLATRSEP
jgi:hypothetical protein